LDETVIVRNLGREPITLAVYANNVRITESGDFMLDDANSVFDLSSWISMAAPSVDVPARSTASIPFRIAIPANAEPGDHAAAVVTAATSQAETTSGTANVTARVGARVYLRVAGEMTPAIRVTGVKPQRDASWFNPLPAPLGVDGWIQNTGNIRLAVTVEVGARGWFGWDTPPRTSREFELLPGTSISLGALRGGGAEGGDVPDGAEGADLPQDVDSAAARDAAVTSWGKVPAVGRLNVQVEASGRIVGSDGETVADSAAAVTWAIPWPAVIVLGGLMAGVATLLLRRQKRTKSEKATGIPAPPPTPPGPPGPPGPACPTAN
jgi:hypothetical protein